MQLNFMFFLNSVLFGLGLAMDAFSVSLANGLAEPCMCRRKQLMIAGTFSVFQGVMPLLGWFCVCTVVHWFSWLEGLIPWVSLVLLSVIGGKMLFGALKKTGEEECTCVLGISALILQGVATSIDAMAVGISLAMAGNVNIWIAILLIGVVTCLLSALGVKLGGVFGARFEKKAQIAGGVILILLGLKILLEHLGVLNF